MHSIEDKFGYWTGKKCCLQACGCAPLSPELSQAGVARGLSSAFGWSAALPFFVVVVVLTKVSLLLFMWDLRL